MWQQALLNMRVTFHGVTLTYGVTLAYLILDGHRPALRYPVDPFVAPLDRLPAGGGASGGRVDGGGGSSHAPQDSGSVRGDGGQGLAVA